MAMSGFSKSILLWGLITLFGYGIYQFYLNNPSFPTPLPLWTLLSLIGIGGMIKWVPHWSKNKVVHVWLVVVILGMVYHWLFASQLVPALIPDPWAYWALVTAIGFLATGLVWTTKHFWYGVGGLHLLLFLVLTFSPATLANNGSIALALVSGLPLIYMGGILQQH
ncbi:MAG: hypothetical protein Q8P05_01415 [Candidatus Diapherotrites archaeon]|nr:hypothetical protein [Candidatus Diapherotrites archaeon]MDZ4256797.1 hypothetical protein [archaeon]